jgi:hypothetical protein
MKKLTVPIFRLLHIALFLTPALLRANGQPEQRQSIFDVLHHEEILELTLETSIDHFKQNRRSEENRKGRIAFRDAQGKKQVWNVKVSMRGAFRRIHCDEMPPLKLNFKKSDLAAAGLAPYDDLKLVPFCSDNHEIARETLYREYLAYRLYNAVTDYSFRVQLVQIKYIDTESGAISEQWAFLIEDTAQLRDRIGAEKAESDNIFNPDPERFDREYLKTVSVFQYMIGNTDWSLSTCKNLKLFVKNGKFIAVPYDFDFSALVNPPYFAPDSDYGLTSRFQRVYIGPREDIDDLHATAHAIAGKRIVMERMIRKFRLLSLAGRRDMLDYLNSFFDNPEEVSAGEKVLAERL